MQARGIVSMAVGARPASPPVAVVGGGAMGSDNSSVDCDAYACRTTYVRRRHQGEMWSSRLTGGDAERRFSARIGFAWRHLCRDHPLAASRRQRCMEELLGHKWATQDIKQVPKDEIQQNEAQEQIIEMPHAVIKITATPIMQKVLAEAQVKVEPGVGNRAREEGGECRGQAHDSKIQAPPGLELVMDEKGSDRTGEINSSVTPSRTLQVQLSEVSTCALSSTKDDEGEEEKEEQEESEAYISGTEDWEPESGKPFGRRLHVRRPRRGRRAKAKARRVEWNAAKHRSYQETTRESNKWGGGNEDLAFALLEAIAEDAHVSEAIRSGDSSSVADTASVSSDHLVEQNASKKCRTNEGGVSTKHRTAFARELHIERSGENKVHSEKSGADDNDNSIDALEMSQDLSDFICAAGTFEIGGELCDHELFEEVAGAKLVPTILLQTLVDYQVAAQRCHMETIETLTRETAELKPKIMAVCEAAKKLEDWDCPGFMARQWSELLVWILEDDEGLAKLLEKSEEAIEEIADYELDEDSAYHLLAASRSRIEDRWEVVVEHLDDIEKAGLRNEYIRQRRIESGDVSLLPTADIQMMLAQRLEESRTRRFGAPG